MTALSARDDGGLGTHLACGLGMATFVGKQSALQDLLCSLLELEFDAIAAYSEAIERLDELTFKVRFEHFRNDHRRHAGEITDALLRMGVDPPERADVKAILTQGKVVVGDLVGDKGILMAMRSNENDTNVAYERVVARDDLGAELKAKFELALADERRHQNWIDDQLSAMNEQVALQPASEEYLGAKWG